jgi:hypothetical protein
MDSSARTPPAGFDTLEGEIGGNPGYHPGGRTSTTTGGSPMPVETPSIFAQVIKEHLDLKERNSRLSGAMPIDRYKGEDPFDNHPLFKTEEQARIEETMDGVEPDFSDTSFENVLAWPGHDAVEEVRAETREAVVPAIEESAFWGTGGARDFDWGD